MAFAACTDFKTQPGSVKARGWPSRRNTFLTDCQVNGYGDFTGWGIALTNQPACRPGLGPDSSRNDEKMVSKIFLDSWFLIKR